MKNELVTVESSRRTASVPIQKETLSVEDICGLIQFQDDVAPGRDGQHRDMTATVAFTSFLIYDPSYYSKEKIKEQLRQRLLRLIFADRRREMIDAINALRWSNPLRPDEQERAAGVLMLLAMRQPLDFEGPPPNVAFRTLDGLTCFGCFDDPSATAIMRFIRGPICRRYDRTPETYCGLPLFQEVEE